ncbi:MAG: AMP-binding protein [Candidatus Bruticola sp.]
MIDNSSRNVANAVGSTRGFDNPQALSLSIPREFNIADHLLQQAVSKNGESIAIVSPRQIVTFNKLAALVNQTGNFLLNHKVGIERRVLLMVKDGIRFASLFLAAIKIGAIPVALPAQLQRHELRYLLDESRAAVAIIDPDDFLTVRELCRELPWKTEVISSVSTEASGGSSMEEERQELSTNLVPAPTTCDDTAFWVYTQGLAGFPKATMHMHRSPLYASASYAHEVLNMDENDIILSTSPLYSCQGIMERIFFPLYSRSSIVMLENELSGSELLDKMRTHKATILFSSPDIYAKILKSAENQHESVSLPNLRACISTNQILTLATQINWRKKFDIDIINALSSTEELYAYITNRPNCVRAGSLGQAAPGYTIRLEDKNGLQIAPGQIGNLMVYGGSTMIGFWNKQKKTNKVLIGPWLDTSDKCIMDEDGFYYFAGKREDMMFIEDHWVSPGDVEQNLLNQPEIAQAAVVSTVDKNDKMRLRAYVVLRPNLEPSGEMATSLRLKANQNQPLHMQIKWIDFVPDLPRSNTGKVQRYKLR